MAGLPRGTDDQAAEIGNLRELSGAFDRPCVSHGIIMLQSDDTLHQDCACPVSDPSDIAIRSSINRPVTMAGGVPATVWHLSCPGSEDTHAWK